MRGSGNIGPPTLDGGECSASLPAALRPWTLGEPLSRSRSYGEEKCLFLWGTEPRVLGRPTRSLVHMLTELFRLFKTESCGTE